MMSESLLSAAPVLPDDVLLVERRDDVLLVTLNRPRKGNALSDELIDAIGDLAVSLHPGGRNGSAIAVVLTGSGSTTFSAGADINGLVGLTETTAIAKMRRGQSVFDALEDAPQVIIAAVNGIAFGGGLELAMACDIRIAAPHARLGQPEITLGNIPGWGGTQRLPPLIGEGRALELIVTGDPVDAARALELGLINSIADDPVSAALALADRIAARSAIAVSAAKQAVYAGVRHGITAGLETEATLVGTCSVSPQQRAAVQAFFDRKKAKPATSSAEQPDATTKES
ncbi:enoyl-CoA hydratase/isomerase family protein [Rathayibacter soli]|uniref:enoyl-CoA hydratase/isomerase family protein n=1 Tax=Rathayibacter soli TaxID=3144168 RepID=UPI0027E5728C|nr:enoyl-CoA hydratase/isomerase family protein [Glaciibacter superstes]